MNVFKQRFCQLVLHEELNVSPSDVYVASFFSIYFWLYVNLGWLIFRVCKFSGVLQGR